LRQSTLAARWAFAKDEAVRRWIVVGVASWLALLAGCVLGGSEEPGCTEDAECGEGFSCRAGACFKERSGVVAPADAGADADADAD
jgi:Cys-rich repeat protein